MQVVVNQTPTLLTVSDRQRVIAQSRETSVITFATGGRVLVETPRQSVVERLVPQQIAVEVTRREILTTGEQGPRGVQGPPGSLLGTVERLNSTGSTIPAGSPVRLTAGGTIALARADAADHRAIGLAQAAIGHGTSGAVVISGPLQLADWSTVAGTATLTDAADYYLVQPTAGLIALVPPGGTGDLLQRLGTAVATDTLWVNPDTIAIC